MCLDYELPKNQSDKIKAKARKRGYIRVWKVCMPKSTGWLRSVTWKMGLRKARNLRDRDGGWYAYIDLKGGKKMRRYWNDSCLDVHSIKFCYAKPSWIKRIGRDWDNNRVAIFTHLAFPDWDKGDMTIREFRVMCRENKP